MAGVSSLSSSSDLEDPYTSYEEESNPKCQNVAYLRYIPARVCKREKKRKFARNFFFQLRMQRPPPPYSPTYIQRGSGWPA